ncbi:MAG: GDSL-type esterase/lipase family protein [Treponema sp.]|jgi:acyl-CoA thioesterase-1|nr:GDSL-type esterase/lipase family protein [Treponema sp.]
MKSKLLFVLWVVFSVVFMACATTRGSTSGEETIVCFGDSLTSGYSATVVGKDDKSKAWPAFLQNKVNIPVINAGVGGDNTAQGLARVKKDVLSKNPRIVIIFLGGNDYIQRIHPDTTKNNLQKIIDMVNDGRRKIYITSFYGPDWFDEVKDMYNTLASSNNIELIDLPFFGEIRAKKELMADELHPNAKGCEIMADYFFKALKPYLEANNLLK